MGILDSIVEWIATQIMNLLDLVTGSVLGALGCDMSTFLRYFPAAETLYEVFAAIAVGFVLLNLVWQLFKNFGLGVGLSAEDPTKLAIKSILFIFLALFADQIMVLILGIAGTPYDWVVDTALPPIEFSNFGSVLTVIVGCLASGSVSLIVLILVIIIAWNYSVTKKPLEGVQFRITYSDGSFVADEGGKLSSNGLYMTDANGEILIRDIVGTLVVTEVKTIPGYTIDEATRSQTIVVNPDDLQTLIVYNIPAGGLQIIKSDEDTGERLGGVKFEIRKINGEILGTYTTDRDGVISIPNAESGWYTIVERKAKDGYALDTTPVNACVKDSETTTVEITNQRMASIMIHKIDAATGAGIYGVKFVLYDSGKNPIGEYTTDQDGYIYIDDELVPGKYYLRELEAADGYIRDEQYKTVYVERGKCAQIEWENSAVTGQIQIRKYSSEDNTVTGQLAGTPLEGAVFEITQARSGKVVGYIVTDARGVAASGPLPLGRYFVTEVSAPKYYQLSGEKMEAEIEYPSQIIKLSAYNKPATLGVTIKKSGNYEVQHGQTMSYDFSGIANTSNVALNHFFWHDRIPTDATRALSISTGTYNARLYYKVTFKTNLNDYRTLASNLLTSNNYSLSLNAATLRLVQGEYVTDVRFEFGTVPSGFSSVMKPTMRVQVLGTMSNGYQIINRADVGGQYLNEWQTAKTTWVTTVRRFNTTPLPKTGY